MRGTCEKPFSPSEKEGGLHCGQCEGSLVGRSWSSTTGSKGGKDGMSPGKKAASPTGLAGD